MRRIRSGVALGEVAFESIESHRPEPRIAGEPVLRFLHRGGVEPARHGAPGLVSFDQAGAFEHVEVLEHRRQRHRERLRQGGDGKLGLFAQARQHGAAGRIGQRGKGSIKILHSRTFI